jgi:hypothetical protein
MKMSDQRDPTLTYKFEHPYRGKASHCGRLSVLYPLTRPERGAGPEELIRCGERLLLKWRQQVYGMSKQRPPFPRTPAQAARMRNCPPTFFKTSTSKAFPCCRDNVCPWCYGRRVMAFYDRVLSAAGADSKVFTATYALKVKGDGAPDLAVANAREILAGLAKANMDRFGKAGCRTEVSVEPWDDDWLVRSRLLAVIPEGEGFSLVPKKWKVRSKKKPAKADVVTAVARACRYPVGLIRGDAGRAAACLACRAGTRMVAHYGLFRGGQKPQESIWRLEEAKTPRDASEAPEAPQNASKEEPFDPLMPWLGGK